MPAEQVEIPVAVREEVSKSATRRLRTQGRIPAVVYGKGAEPIAISVDAREFARAVSAAGWYSTLINLRVEGAEAEDRPTVMIKEVQHDLVDRRVVSIDFRRVSLQETIQTHVTLRVVGESPGVKAGGILDQVLHEVMVECLPTDMPDHIEVQISQLGIGDSARVRDLVVPEGVTVVAPQDEVVIHVAPPLREEEIQPAAPEEGALVEEVVEPEVVGEKRGAEAG
jgi:large subunit ribosomal protein L25